jgi:regulator of replication initiation timing
MAQLQGQQPVPRTGLFHKNAPPQLDLKEFTEDIGNLGRRLRILEESITNIRRAIQVTEQNMLDKNKIFATEIRTLTSDMGDMKTEISEIKEKIVEVVGELKESAKRDEVKVLEKYINFWNPVNFVTQNEVETIVKEILKKKATK